jgi:apolipoprotein N-acyltransferase
MIFNKKHLPALLALLFGAISVLGFAPFYMFPVPIIAIAGLCYLWVKAGTPATAWILGFSYGLGLYCVGIYWIYISLHDFGGMPWWFAGFCTFCLCAFMALFVGLVGYFSKKLSVKNQSLLWLSVPVLWGLSDWVRSWIFTGFPWLTMGYSQVPHSPLAGYMPIVGVYGVSVISVFISALIGFWLANKRQTPLFKRNTIGFITLTLVAGFILKTVEWTTPAGTPIKVALVQGNIEQSTKWSPEKAQGTIDQYLSMLLTSKADLIILPETALPVIYSQLDENVKNTLLTHAKQHPLIIGLVEYKAEFDEKLGEYFYSALGFGNTDGESLTQSYAKNHLVPFGEFIPLKKVFGWIYRDWLNMPLSDLSRGGAQQQPMHLAGQKIGVNICYEDVFGEEIIRQLPEATMLVNISNDAWYGQSYAADQHMQFSQARALETGRYMLRATNTGATASIDQHGYVLEHAPHDTQTTLDVTAQGYTGSTPYVRWGNWPFIMFCFGTLGFVANAFVIRRKTKLK